MNNHTKVQQEIEGTDKKPTNGQDHPPAGPHDKPHLQDESKTPGAGSLPDKDDESVSPGSSWWLCPFGLPEQKRQRSFSQSGATIDRRCVTPAFFASLLYSWIPWRAGCPR